MEGVKLNLSRFLMILHNAEIIDHTIDKILKGAQDQETKIHIGASYYLSANSPYKTVAIRMWKKPQIRYKPHSKSMERIL